MILKTSVILRRLTLFDYEGGVDIGNHKAIDNFGNEFEAIVNVTVKCRQCGKIQELVMCAKDEVTE